MSAIERPFVTRTRAWLVGVVAGLVLGFPTLGLAVFGIALAVALVVGAGLSRPRLASVGGVLIGLGIPWSLLLGRANAACDVHGCDGEALAAWFIAALFVLTLGVAISLAEVLRAHRRGDRSPQ